MLSPGHSSMWKKAVSLLLFLAGAGFLSGYGQQIPKAQRYYDRGIVLAGEHKYREASEQFAKAIDINPEYSEAYYQLGISSVADGRPQGAIRAFMQLAQLEPTKSEPVLAAAQLYYGLGFMDDALALSVRALLIEPKNASIYFNIGLIYSKQKQPLLAIEALEHAVTLRPSMVKARLLLASAYLSSGKEADAISTLQDGMKADPDNPALMTGLGEIYLRALRLPEAEKEFRSSLSNKETLQAHIGLAKMYRLKNQLPDAIAEMNSVLRKHPDASEALLERGIDLYESGDRQAARRDLEAFSEAQNNRPEGYFYLGQIDLDEHQPETAVAHLKRSLDLAPGNCDGQTSLAKAYLSLNQVTAAEDSLTGCTPQNASAAKLLEEIQKHTGPAAK